MRFDAVLLLALSLLFVVHTDIGAWYGARRAPDPLKAERIAALRHLSPTPPESQPRWRTAAPADAPHRAGSQSTQDSDRYPVAGLWPTLALSIAMPDAASM